jgi:serine/threonine protein kinase
LEYLFRQGIVHRDINPQHVLVNCDESGCVDYKLTGFHFCKVVNEERVYKPFVGTIEYSAPEVGSEGSYSFKTDI